MPALVSSSFDLTHHGFNPYGFKGLGSTMLCAKGPGSGQPSRSCFLFSPSNHLGGHKYQKQWLGLLITKEPFLCHISTVPFSLLSGCMICNFPLSVTPAASSVETSEPLTAQKPQISCNRCKAQHVLQKVLCSRNMSSSSASI